MTILSQQGNEPVILFVASVLPKLDGGELEDAAKILGESMDAHPELLMRLFSQKILTKKEFSFAVGSTPARYVDDLKTQAAILRKRQAAVELTNDPDLAPAKDISLSVIKGVLEGHQQRE